MEISEELHVWYRTHEHGNPWIFLMKKRSLLTAHATKRKWNLHRFCDHNEWTSCTKLPTRWFSLTSIWPSLRKETEAMYQRADSDRDTVALTWSSWACHLEGENRSMYGKSPCAMWKLAPLGVSAHMFGSWVVLERPDGTCLEDAIIISGCLDSNSTARRPYLGTVCNGGGPIELTPRSGRKFDY